jgi:hypothetical protein
MASTEQSQATDAPVAGAPEQDGTVKKISLEEFTPMGTLVVTGLYFLLLLVLYALMYFVEFAGHGPSIIE